MTKDGIAALMNESAGADWGDEAHFQRFATLVAAAERLSMHSNGWRQCAVGQKTTQFCGATEAAVLAEREACAKACDETERPNLYGVRECAAAIRARGDA